MAVLEGPNPTIVASLGSAVEGKAPEDGPRRNPARRFAFPFTPSTSEKDEPGPGGKWVGRLYLVADSLGHLKDIPFPVILFTWVTKGTL